MHKLTLSIVVRNGAEYISYLVASLKNQIFKDFEMIVVDNGSTDKTKELIKSELDQSGIEYRLIENSVNQGFAIGNNQAYKLCRTPFFALLNADTFIMPDVLEKIIDFMDRHSNTTAVAPRLMRWDFELSRVASQSGVDYLRAARQGFTSQIDAVGIRLFRNRRAVEWLTRYEWANDSSSLEVQKIYDKQTLEVFGVSGAFAVYRKNIIDQVLLPGENIFDPTYHSYKEDLDLAYRLRNAGYVSYVILNAIVYHNRTGAGPKKMSDWAALRNKTTQSYFVRFHSYKNHLRTLYKNEYWQNFLIDLPLIIWYEFKKFIYILLTDPKIIFLGWLQIFKEGKYLRQSRRVVVKSRRMYWKGLRRWWL